MDKCLIDRTVPFNHALTIAQTLCKIEREMKQLFITITLFLTFCTTPVFSQNNDWVSYTSGNSIVDIVQDSNLTWIATTGGIVKINETFNDTVFYTKSNADFETYLITSIEVDDNHNLWVGTDGNGLYRYDGNNWEKNPNGVSLPSQYVSDIKNDNSGNIWIGCKFWLEQTSPFPTPHFGGLLMFNGKIWSTFTQYLSPTNSRKNVYKINTDNNNLIIADGGIILYDGISWQYLKPDNNASVEVKAFAVDSLNNIWTLQDSSKLSKYDGNTWFTYPVNLSLTPEFFFNNTITSGFSNNIYIGSDVNNNLGLVIFDGTTWSNYSSSNSSLPTNRITSLFFNKELFYIGTHGKELIYSDSNYVFIQKNTSNSTLNGNILNTVYIDSSGVVYTSAYNYANGASEISYFNGYSWSNLDSIPTGGVKAIIKDKQNNLWVGGSKGVAYFNGINWFMFDVSNTNFPHNRINSISIDKDDNIWVAGGSSYKAFIAKFDGSSWTVHLPPRVPYAFYKIVIDKSNNKWIAGYDGLFEFDDTNQWKTYTNFSGPRVILNSVFDLDYSISTNDLWLATAYGLFKKDSNDFIQYSNSRIDCLAIDTNENIWVYPSGKDSIIVFDKTGQVVQTFTSDNSGLPFTPYVTDISVTNEGNVYMASELDGLIHYNRGNEVSINEISVSDNNQINIFPNPCQGILTIKSDDLQRKSIGKLYSMDGKLIRVFNIDMFSNQTEINLNPLLPGIYLLNINDRYFNKIVISND